MVKRLHVLVQGQELISRPFNEQNDEPTKLGSFPVVTVVPGPQSSPGSMPVVNTDPRVLLHLDTGDVVVRTRAVGAWWVHDDDLP